MSLIITINTHEGIVMASDSRSTGSTTSVNPDGSVQYALGSQITDTTYKTFLCYDKIGISTCGDAAINDIPMIRYIERFIAERINKDSNVDFVACELVKYFEDISQNLRLHFYVAGYDNNSAVIKQIKLENRAANIPIIETINTSSPGTSWDGEFLTLTKLLRPLYIENGGTFLPLPSNSINWQYFTLQDAIDFAKYAVEVTIKTMAFQNCVKTVGGPIDILVIKPDKALWIARKELHA